MNFPSLEANGFILAEEFNGQTLAVHARPNGDVNIGDTYELKPIDIKNLSHLTIFKSAAQATQFAEGLSRSDHYFVRLNRERWRNLQPAYLTVSAQVLPTQPL